MKVAGFRSKKDQARPCNIELYKHLSDVDGGDSSDDFFRWRSIFTFFIILNVFR